MMHLDPPVCKGRFVTYDVVGRQITIEIPEDALLALQVEDLVLVMYDGEQLLKGSDGSIGNVMAFDRSGKLKWQIAPFTEVRHSEYAVMWVEGGKVLLYVTADYKLESDPATGAFLGGPS